MTNENPRGSSPRRRFGLKEAGLLALGALGWGGGGSTQESKPTEKTIETAPAARKFVPGKKEAEKGLEPGVTAFRSDSWNYSYQDPVAVAEARRLRELKQDIADLPTEVSNAPQVRSSHRRHRHHNGGENS